MAAWAIAMTAACSAGGSSDTPAALETVYPGAPPDVTLATDPVVTTDDDPRHVVFVTLGSSSCPNIPMTAEWDADAEALRVTLGTDASPDEPCSADEVLTTSVLRLPPEAPNAAGITVVVDGQEFTVGTS